MLRAHVLARLVCVLYDNKAYSECKLCVGNGFCRAYCDFAITTL